MSIKLNVTDQDKKQMANFAVEFQVLSAMARERKFLMDSKAGDILTANGLDLKLYAMNFNPAEDKWDAILKPGALAVPVPGSNVKNIRGNGG